MTNNGRFEVGDVVRVMTEDELRSCYGDGFRNGFKIGVNSDMMSMGNSLFEIREVYKRDNNADYDLFRLRECGGDPVRWIWPAKMLESSYESDSNICGRPVDDIFDFLNS